MPPPIPAQQSSRAGLISALVFFIILSIVAIVFWISNNQKLVKAETDLDTVKKKYGPVVTDAELSEANYTTALEEMKETGAPSAFDVVRAQRDELAKVLAGTVVSTKDARRLAEGGVQLAIDALPKGKDGNAAVPISKTAPITMIPQQVAQAYAQLYTERDALTAQLATAIASAQSKDAEHQKAVTDLGTQIAAKDQEIAKVKAEIEGYRQQQTTSLATLTADTAKQIQDLSAAIAAGQAQITQIAAQSKDWERKYKNVLPLLAKYRLDPKENITRKPDGAITRLPGNNICFINLGEGDHISVGMTFEVYDRSKGIPPVGDGLTEEEGGKRRPSAAPAAGAAPAAPAMPGRPAEASLEVDMPRGKGSIEVTAIGPGKTAQCRIIKVEPGQVLNEGDIIGNLVYDPRIKPVFFVYGDFDLNNDGQSSVQDANVIKRLIEQWGGRVLVIDPNRAPVESLALETDFVIFGKEPRVPNLSEEEKADPVAAARAAKLTEEHDKWIGIRQRAAELGIPVMNQNRFLYYTGYFDQKTR